MTNREISETLEQVIRYFGRCYLNSGNGTKAKEQFKTYMAAVSVAKYKVEHKRRAKDGSVGAAKGARAGESAQAPV